MLSIIKSAALMGINSYPVDVEVDLSNGLPAFDIVGLPDAAVKEARERVRAAAKKFGVSKSTVFTDVTVRLKKVNPALYNEVRQVLEKNKEERHIRGGIATKEKYLSDNKNK